MKAFRNHFTGEVNATSKIAKAERLRDSLHYNNGRSMKFELFLTKSQNIYNIFEG